jgi:citrate lyase beta subunit
VEAAKEGGVVSVDGQMIDGPLIKQAQQVMLWLDRPPRGSVARIPSGE